jgi:hypothetical protein
LRVNTAFGGSLTPANVGTGLVDFFSVSQSHFATDSQSVCLGVEPRLGLMTRYLFLIESYSPVHMGRPL